MNRKIDACMTEQQEKLSFPDQVNKGDTLNF